MHALGEGALPMMIVAQEGFPLIEVTRAAIVELLRLNILVCSTKIFGSRIFSTNSVQRFVFLLLPLLRFPPKYVLKVKNLFSLSCSILVIIA